MPTVLMLWDAVFASASQNHSLELIEFLCISMLLRIRRKCKVYTVVTNETMEALHVLMKYPAIGHVEELITLALRVKEFISLGSRSLKPQLQPLVSRTKTKR